MRGPVSDVEILNDRVVFEFVYDDEMVGSIRVSNVVEEEEEEGRLTLVLHLFMKIS